VSAGIAREGVEPIGIHVKLAAYFQCVTRFLTLWS
jgi:hypothetical protein